MEFQKIIDRSIEIRKQYEAKEKKLYGSVWTSEEKLAHELADCLWSVIVLAQIHEVDLENSFMSTMNELEKHLSEG